MSTLSPEGQVTEAQLIASQALEIARYKQAHEDLLLRFGAVHDILYCIGGPLNDNKHGFTKEQRAVFHQIAEQVDL
jgi:hypothetical protein